MDLDKLSKIVSHALRHEPLLYGIELDKEGWANIELLIHGIKMQSKNYNDLSIVDLVQMIKKSKKKRHELVGDKIRAFSGHSTREKIVKKSSTPPEFLYHGTREAVLNEILKEGLLPMERQYVHLSENKETAIQVALRKTTSPIILKVQAKQACSIGVNFYEEYNGQWISDKIPPNFLML